VFKGTEFINIVCMILITKDISCVFHLQICHICPFNDHTAKTRDELQLHLWERHRYRLVRDDGNDWAVSKHLQRKLKIRRSVHTRRRPGPEQAAVTCSLSMQSPSASTAVSTAVDVADQTVVNNQSSASGTEITSTTVSTASVSSLQDVIVTSSVIR